MVLLIGLVRSGTVVALVSFTEAIDGVGLIVASEFVRINSELALVTSAEDV